MGWFSFRLKWSFYGSGYQSICIFLNHFGYLFGFNADEKDKFPTKIPGLTHYFLQGFLLIGHQCGAGGELNL